jgi:hypothetical protein
VAPEVALGRGGFADDLAPADALVAVPSADGDWVVGETLSEALRAAGKVPGRRTTRRIRHPLELPEGDWAVRLRTTWVEPGYLETDASWCEPGGRPASPLANGGAFGGKDDTDVARVARRLADRHGRPVRVRYAREDVVRRGPKRPPIAAGMRLDGTGTLRVVRTAGLAEAVRAVAPGLSVEELVVRGPRTSASIRGAGWTEVAVLRSALRDEAGPVRAPNGARAEAEVSGDGLQVRVACGDPLDEVVLRSYCIGAAHMALGWVTSEGLTVDEHGQIHDLTVRSFGIVPASAMPDVAVEIVPSDDEPVNGSDAVFAAVAAAVWRYQGRPPEWPTGLPL